MVQVVTENVTVVTVIINKVIGWVAEGPGGPGVLLLTCTVALGSQATAMKSFSLRLNPPK